MSLLILLGSIIVVETLVIVFLLRNKEKRAKSVETIGPLNEEYKLVMLVRKDLKMGKGKIAAQCGHAAVGCVLKAQKHDPVALNTWRYIGQAKVALSVDNLEELFVGEDKQWKAYN